jgi:hypothetical protein
LIIAPQIDSGVAQPSDPGGVGESGFGGNGESVIGELDGQMAGSDRPQEATEKRAEREKQGFWAEVR